MEKKFGVFSSSANPQELSLTVKSIVKIVGLVIGSYASLQGIDGVITDEQLSQIADAVIVIVTASLTIVQSGDFLLGVARKVFARLFA